MSWGVTGYGWAQNNLRFRFLQIQALSLIGWSFDAAHCTAIVCCISSTLMHYLTFNGTKLWVHPLHLKMRGSVLAGGLGVVGPTKRRGRMLG